mmetsp:Transcript_2172/g.7527  ORF Transcript_2172/g.7527 Transcript_2172/m.7527 type:complete len:98 (+) Transcript_2172:1151-1444(+)
MNTRASALRSALPNPKTGEEVLRESCCTPSMDRPAVPDDFTLDLGRRTASGIVWMMDRLETTIYYTQMRVCFRVGRIQSLPFACLSRFVTPQQPKIL